MAVGRWGALDLAVEDFANVVSRDPQPRRSRGQVRVRAGGKRRQHAHRTRAPCHDYTVAPGLVCDPLTYIVMACKVISIAMAYIVMAYDLYSYGLFSYGSRSGLRSTYL